ncbi:Cytochrome P450 4e1, partial [Carabus blaptoides fortunei]
RIMIVLSVLVCVTLGLAIYAYSNIQKHHRFSKMLNVFPGRKCTLLLGNIQDFSTDPVQVFNCLRNYSKEFPKGFRYWCGILGVYNVNTPDEAEIILSNIKYIKKSIIYKFLHPWLESGLLTSTVNR